MSTRLHRLNKHMINDTPGGRTRTPGNRGRKWPPFRRGFLTLPWSGAIELPEKPDQERGHRR